MATPKKPPEELQRRGRKPRDPSGPTVPVFARVPEDQRQRLIDQYGSVTAGVAEAVRRLVGAK